MNRWHTRSIGIKAVLIYTLLVISFLTFFNCFAIMIGTQEDDYIKFLTLVFCCYISLTMLIFMFRIHLVYFVVVARESSIPSKNVSVGFLGSLISMMLTWWQFISVIAYKRNKTAFMLTYIISIDVCSFCVAELCTLVGLYNGLLLLVPDLGYFKFVMAASVCTQYFLTGFGTHFWIVLSVCIAFSLLHGNIFKSSDAAAHSFSRVVEETSAASDHESQPFWGGNFLLNYFRIYWSPPSVYQR